MYLVVVTALAFALDAVFGDPRWLPHPVVAMGRAISWAEPRLRAAFPDSPAGRRRAGRVLAACLPAASFCLVWAALVLLGAISPVARFAAEVYLCYQLLAACELRRQSLAVARALATGGVIAARRAVGMIVGRDTSSLDAAGCIRASVETVAENASDGVIAPLLYMMIGGAPLAAAYKAVNTLDSMVGYKNPRYIDFGRASARLDDVANWIPARVTALCMVATAPLAGLSASGAAGAWLRDHASHLSPNAGHPESAVAGALGVRLNGPGVYGGVLVQKPYVGDATRQIEPGDVARTCRLMYAASMLALAAAAVIRLAICLAAR